MDIFYPDAGILVLGGSQMSQSLPRNCCYKTQTNNGIPAVAQGSGLCH